MTKDNPLTIDSVGRRHYLCGDTYAIRQQIKDAGFRWDPDRRCWWTGQRKKAEAFLPQAEKAVAAKDDFRVDMDRRRSEGLMLAGTACKADEAKRHGGVWDRQREAWLFPTRDALEACKSDAAKRRAAKPKAERSVRWNQVALVGKTADITVVTVQPGGPRGYKPEVADLVGRTRMIKHRGESVPLTTTGVEAYYLRGEDAEDQGDYRGSGWRIVEYMRVATSEEAAPVVQARATKQRREELLNELRTLVKSPETHTDAPWPTGKRVGGHGNLAGSSGYVVGTDFVSWLESSYDDMPRHWRTTDPRAVEIAKELFGVTQDNPVEQRQARTIANGGE